MRPGDFVDYYEILGLTPAASEGDVRDAWRRCARMYHPDLNPRKTSFRFRRAKEAYDVLSDPVRRREYDRRYKLHSGLFGRQPTSKRSGSFKGTPPGARNPPPPSSGPTRPPGGSTGPRSRPPGSSRSTGAKGSAPPPGAGSANPPPGARSEAPNEGRFSPGPSDVRTRTTFRPSTITRQESGATMVDSLRDAILQGGVSRVTVRHNGNVVWETHITSGLLDDFTRWVVGPITGLLRLLGQEEQFQIELANEVMEEYNRANKLYDEGKLPEAKAAYKRCIERDRYFAPAHLSLGAVYEAQAEIPVAIQCYQNAVKIDPVGEAGRFARENLRRLRGF